MLFILAVFIVKIRAIAHIAWITHTLEMRRHSFSRMCIYFVFMAEAAGRSCINDGLSVGTEAVAASNSDLSAMQ